MVRLDLDEEKLIDEDIEELFGGPNDPNFCLTERS